MRGEIGIGSGRSLFISSLKALLNWQVVEEIIGERLSEANVVVLVVAANIMQIGMCGLSLFFFLSLFLSFCDKMKNNSKVIFEARPQL